jgi:hypothetical protein
MHPTEITISKMWYVKFVILLCVIADLVFYHRHSDRHHTCGQNIFLMFYYTLTKMVGKEESTDWVKRVVAVASATEDAAAINESHNAVLGKILFAVDAPDGEHDMEDVVSVSSEPFNRFAILH